MRGRLRLALFGIAVIALTCATGPSVSAQVSGERVRISYTQRLRIETTNRAVGLDDSADGGTSYVRNRTSIMARTFPVNRLEITAQLTNEFRYHFVPENVDFSWHEVFVDLLYAKWDSVANLPLSLSIGRQNLSFGEGFVVMEGTPLDGSRSLYFNAARADWTITPGQTLSLVYVSQPVEEKYLPLVNDQDAKLTEQPEQAVIAHYSRSWQKSTLQAYFIHKEAESAADNSEERVVNCIGARLQVPVVARLSLVGEGACQFGTIGTADQSAYGGYGYAEYTTGWPMHLPKNFSGGGIYLSGDDLTTGDDEGWDPLYGRWPKWSDSYIYTLVRERAVAYWTNLSSVFLKTTVPVTPDLLLSLDYHHLTAPERDDPGKALPGGKGTHRGDLFIGRLSYQMNPHLTGHLIYEGFTPGNYYFDGADPYGWMRMEMMLRF